MCYVMITAANPEKSKTIMVKDGWQIAHEKPDSFVAKHDEVKDQKSARHRLDSIGLLISSTIQIQIKEKL